MQIAYYKVFIFLGNQKYTTIRRTFSTLNERIYLFFQNLWNGEGFSSYSECLQVLTLE